MSDEHDASESIYHEFEEDYEGASELHRTVRLWWERDIIENVGVKIMPNENECVKSMASGKWHIYTRNYTCAK